MARKKKNPSTTELASDGERILQRGRELQAIAKELALEERRIVINESAKDEHERTLRVLLARNAEAKRKFAEAKARMLAQGEAGRRMWAMMTKGDEKTGEAALFVDPGQGASRAAREIARAGIQMQHDLVNPQFLAERAGAEVSRRSGVEAPRSGRMARSSTFLMKEESGRTIAAKAAIARRGEEVTDEAVEYELQRTDVPSAKAALNPAPFWKDSQVRPERTTFLSKEKVRVYECGCGRIVDRNVMPQCICKVSTRVSGRQIAAHNRQNAKLEAELRQLEDPSVPESTKQAIRELRARREGRETAEARQRFVRAKNDREAGLKAGLSVSREAVKGRGARPALLTEDRTLSPVDPHAATKQAMQTFYERRDKFRSKITELQAKLDADAADRRLPYGARQHIEKSVKDLRRKAEEIDRSLERMEKEHPEGAVFRLGGIDIGLGLGSAIVAGIGLFLVYRTFQAPTA